MKNRILAALLIMFTLLALPACEMLGFGNGPGSDSTDTTTASVEAFENHDPVISTPIDDDLAFIKWGDGKPHFTDDDWNGDEYYIELAELDSLGRVGVTQGLFDYDHFPTEDRGDIGSVTPTGWYYNGKSNNHTYSFVDARYIWNRCHTLGFQFSGLNAEPRALITGTRYFNIDGNLAYENIVADHMREMDGTNGEPMHQVLVKVTPDFHDDNMVCHGVVYEADCRQCDDIDFAVYMFNKQPGVTIDYRTGENWANTDEAPAEDDDIALEDATYILNTRSMKFHVIGASCAPDPTSANYKLTDLTRAEIINDGYDPCGSCKP